MDRLQSMRVFQQVIDEGGFAAAARKLDLSPAVVTRLVSDLEKHLGVRLLQRTTRKLSLTQAGEAYLERLKVILCDIDEADAMVQAHAKEMSGTVRVLAPPVASTHMLAPAIVAFQRLHPGVHVEVHVDDSHDPPVNDYDLAVLSSAAVLDSSVIVRPIVLSQTVFCASPAYLRQHGEPKQPDDLLRHRYLRLRLSGARLGTLRLLDPTRDDLQLELDVPTVLTVNHTDTLVRATLEGGGISSQPFDLLAPLLRDGRLKRVLAPWITSRVAMIAALPSRQFMPARTRAFLDCLVEHTRKMTEGLTVDLPRP